MHKYTRSGPNTTYSNFFKQIFGYVHSHTNQGWGAWDNRPQVSKFGKNQNFSGSDKVIFERNQNF